jgi:hypothetical protein
MRKTRVSAKWLQSRGFDPTLVERAFDKGTFCKLEEPSVALCGFDGQGPRHILDRAKFDLVVECGLGGRAENFDAISFHTLPNSSRTASQIWPTVYSQENSNQRAIKLANENQVYQSFRDKNKCGHIELAGKAVAVPFVGATASSLVIAETLRAMHDGERYENIELRLECPSMITARRLLDGNYQQNRLNIQYQAINP